jgi:hypothetical protein
VRPASTLANQALTLCETCIEQGRDGLRSQRLILLKDLRCLNHAYKDIEIPKKPHKENRPEPKTLSWQPRFINNQILKRSLITLQRPCGMEVSGTHDQIISNQRQVAIWRLLDLPDLLNSRDEVI